VYGKDSYLLGAVKYWVREFKGRELAFVMQFDPGDP
jgi:hypothetical protein